MTSSVSTHRIFYLISPFSLCVFLVLLTGIPIRSASFCLFCIPFVYTVIYYFAIFRPIVLNVGLVFLIGLFSDILTGSPIGFNSFLMTLLFFMTNLNRRILGNASFLGQWVGFGLNVSVVFFVSFILIALISRHGIIVSKTFFDYFFVILSYPIMAYVCGFLNKRIGEFV